MTGVTIISERMIPASEELVKGNPLSGIVVGVVFLIIVCGIIYAGTLAIREFWRESKIVASLGIILVLSGIGLFFDYGETFYRDYILGRPLQEEYVEYTIEVSSDIDFNELFDKYYVISSKENIFIVKEK